MNKLKGVILAGGNGTRLKPLTNVTNKHLLPVWNKPMIMYPLQTLLDMGIKDILIVTGGEYLGQFVDLLGSGSKFGCNFTYKVQDEAGGIAQALLLAEDFVDEQFAVILGDNIFEYSVTPPTRGYGFVLKKVKDPKRFGVYYDGAIEEKPLIPKSDMAVTGLYFYNKEVFNFIKTLEPSARGELEITDVNNWCLKQDGEVEYEYDAGIVKYQGFWSDAGTFESLFNATQWSKSKS
jgi:glucose-1-phosphate thymidylyltransferase